MRKSYLPPVGNELMWQVAPQGATGRGVVRKVEEDRLVIAVPSHAPKVAVGQLLVIASPATDGMSTFPCKVVSIEGDPRTALVVRREGPTTLVQRRRYVRMPIRMRIVGSPVSPPGPQLRGTSVDISGGGIRGVFDKPAVPFLINARMQVEFTLPGEQPVRTLARIAHAGLASGAQVEIGMEFIGLPERTQDRIIKYIQARTLVQRKDDE